MSAPRILRTMIGISAAVLLGMAVPMMPAVAEKQLPEEALLENMRAGDVEAARDGFEALVTNRVEQFRAVPADHAEASAARVLRATALVRAVRLWQFAEVEQRLAGIQPPNDLNARMMAMAEVLIESAVTVEQVRILLNTEPDVPAWLDRRTTLASERLGQTMLETAAFLRDANLEDDRQRLMQEAGKYITVPATLRELDIQQGDLAKTFGVSAPSQSPLNTSAQTKTAAPSLETVSDPQRDAALRVLLENYYTKLFAGDVAALQTLFAAGYWPGQKLDYVAQKLSGCVLESLGEIQSQLVAPSEYYVEIRNLVCIDKSMSGDRRVMADHLLIKREGENYRILLLDVRDR